MPASDSAVFSTWTSRAASGEPKAFGLGGKVWLKAELKGIDGGSTPSNGACGSIWAQRSKPPPGQDTARG
ncbi:hypothetical protein JTE90_020207 [Oedothorax gibbosus]|uniref:Uncharacterized protein n=1 Tax=Oedothorax gibbosus TaxID=931172 RepID=A0AAV6THE5_9ARAC|nr:hypothetical protein JTE90_020207 [Oedothorax gibbosus]